VRCSIGEADIVARAPDERTIVLVEVKSRVYSETGPAKIPPEAAITAFKRKKLLAIFERLSRANGWEKSPRRIDVIAVEFRRDGGETQIRHFVDAVRSASRGGRSM
jgi:Holliday junction resolvase-like predicted endonuclease